ncbi:hypothetical protein EsDP_00006861 [Epichloe bromicola]|uniref:Anaphase-promoting complex subunit 4-like WD40 domain-containing protein n=1 Tax=Epichloe bromicola TaxID=79588 RepID=A0ABQ0CYW4_9HYPO
MVVKEFLDSDRVNFLIWRYLLEGNYRETAAKFQKEWHVREPHRDFAFAPHVKGRALISVVNRGLLYYALERDFALKQLPGDATNAEAEALQVGIFGPLKSLDEISEGGTGTEAGDVEASRKRMHQQLPNGSPSKRPRLSNGYADAPTNPNESNTNAGASASSSVSAFAPASAPAPATATAAPATNAITSVTSPVTATATTTTTTTMNSSSMSNIDNNNSTSNPATTNTPAASSALVPTPMDVDDDHQHPTHPRSLDDSHSLQDLSNNHAYPSPLEGEQLPPPIIRTDGPEQGTQVDKVEELSPDTTFIRLMDDDGHGSMPEATATPSPSPASAENAPVLLQCEWNPRDPSVLAAAGTDALARVWTISRSTAPEPGRDHVSPRAHTLLDPEAPRTTTVTALSWTSDGTAIAVATDSGSLAAVSVWSADGVHMQTMEVSEPPVIKLSWNPSNTALLAISPEKGGAVVTVYSSATGTAFTHHLPGHDIAATPLDATWTNDADFLLTGGDLLLYLRCSETDIIQVRRFETNEDDSFTQVLFDWRSKLAATSSDKGTLDLWDESGQRRSISAHQGAITTMAWQPLLPTQLVLDDERMIATGGEDCAILIWNARKPESKAKCFLTMDSPIVRLAFTPDGAFIAGATSRQVLIWKVDSHSMPRASWNRPPHPGWLSPKGSSESDEEDEHCLCWDVSGQKLAYGSNSRLAVINFRK